MISHENINKWEKLSPAFMTDESSDDGVTDDIVRIQGTRMP